MSNWTSTTLDKFYQAPNQPGVYVICRARVVLYVGQSLSLFARLRQHIGQLKQSQKSGKLRGTLPPDLNLAGLHLKYKAFTRDSGEWLALEYRLIRRLKPKLNGKTDPGHGWTKSMSGQQRRDVERATGTFSRKWTPAEKSRRRQQMANRKEFLRDWNHHNRLGDLDEWLESRKKPA